MRQVAQYAPSPSLYINPSSSPSPSASVPSAAAAVGNHDDGGMLLSVFLALFLPCALMSAMFVIYICILWVASNPPINQRRDSSAANGDDLKPHAKKGLSAAELDNLPKVAVNELPMGNECAVCLDEIESEQIARRIPVCNHGFHIECADKWLSKHPFCPVCRGKIDREQLVINSAAAAAAAAGGGGGEQGDDDDSPV